MKLSSPFLPPFVVAFICVVFQAFIEAENLRLESESSQFSAKEITIRVEYKYCPNLTIIDTPGLIAPAPGGKNRVLQVNSVATDAFPLFCVIFHCLEFDANELMRGFCSRAKLVLLSH